MNYQQLKPGCCDIFIWLLKIIAHGVGIDIAVVRLIVNLHMGAVSIPTDGVIEVAQWDVMVLEYYFAEARGNFNSAGPFPEVS